jgi:hypothetical protein
MDTSFDSRSAKTEWTDSQLAKSASLTPSGFTLPQLRKSLEKISGELDHLDLFFSCNSDLAGCALPSLNPFREVAKVGVSTGPLEKLCKVAEGYYLSADHEGKVHEIRFMNGQWSSIGEISLPIQVKDFRVLSKSEVLLLPQVGDEPIVASLSFGQDFGTTPATRAVPELNGASFVRLLARNTIVTVGTDHTLSVLTKRPGSNEWICEGGESAFAPCIELRTLPDKSFCVARQDTRTTSIEKWAAGQRGWQSSGSPIEFGNEYSALHITDRGHVVLGSETGLIQHQRVLSSSVTLIRSLGAGVFFAADDSLNMVVFSDPGESGPFKTTRKFKANGHEARDMQCSNRGEILTAGSDGFVRVWQQE